VPSHESHSLVMPKILASDDAAAAVVRLPLALVVKGPLEALWLPLLQLPTAAALVATAP